MKGAPVRITTSRTGMAMLIAAGLLVSLGACSAPAPEPSATAAAEGECTSSGAGSKSVEVTGDFDVKPEVTFDAGLAVKSTERSVAIKGDGAEVKLGDQVQVQLSIFNGTTGEDIQSTTYAEGEEAAFLVDQTLLPGLVKTFECSTVGSRIVGVVPPADAFGDAGNDQLGVGGKDTLVFVIDIVAITPPLTPAAWTENVPEVTFAADGTPTVTLPATAPPTELLATTLTEGDGAAVKRTDVVTVDYQGTSWEKGEVFDQSYGKEPLPLAVSSFVPGFTAALVGQKIGSTVLVTIPPQYGYGLDPAAHPLGGQTLVFLIAIISVA